MISIRQTVQGFNYSTFDKTEELQKDNPSIVKNVSSGSPYPYFEFCFCELDSTDSAKKLYSSIYNQLWEKYDPHRAESESYYNNYSSHEFYDEDGYYYTVIRVSNTIVYPASREATQDKIYEILVAMDYDSKTDK